MPDQLWEVVGGKDSGGILVREGRLLKSQPMEKRLATGTVVAQAERAGDRLKYKLESGSGPDEGWISVKMNNKDLVVPVQPLSDCGTEPKISTGTADEVEEVRSAWSALLTKSNNATPSQTTLKEGKPWIVPVKPAPSRPPARMRLVFCDWTGNRGGAGSFHGGAVRSSWEQWLAEASPKDTWEVCKLELPGRGMRPKDPNAESAREVAVSAVEGLRKSGLNGIGTVLFGFSFGAIIAYEIAALLVKHGAPPLGLVVASAEYPQWIGRVNGAGESHGPTKDMDGAAFEAMLREKKGTDMVLGMPGEMKDRAIAAIRADMQMEESYGAGLPSDFPMIPCPVVVFRGKSCPIVAREDVEPWLQLSALGNWGPSRVEDLETGLKPNPDQHWLSDWYLLQSDQSAKYILRAIAKDFGSAS